MPPSKDRRDRPPPARLPGPDSAEEAAATAPLVRMSPQGFEVLLAALSVPATAVPEMVEILRRSAPWEDATAE